MSNNYWETLEDDVLQRCVEGLRIAQSLPGRKDSRTLLASALVSAEAEAESRAFRLRVEAERLRLQRVSWDYDF